MKKIAAVLGVSAVCLALAAIGEGFEAQAKVPAAAPVVSHVSSDEIGIVGDELLGSCKVSEESCRKAWKTLGQLLSTDL